MRMRDLRLVAVLTTLALSLSAVGTVPALADGNKHGKRYRVQTKAHGNKHWKKHRNWKNDRAGYRVRYTVVQRPRRVIYRPVVREHFYWQRPQFVVVRPVPVFVRSHSNVSGRIGIHVDNVSFDVAFGRRHPYYGCGFCEEYFTQYSGWESHVQDCDHGPRGRRVCERWDDDDYSYYESEARDQWDDEYYEDDGHYRR